LPLAGVAVAGGFLAWRRRRGAAAS
jgi:hypothetical protein